MWVAVLWLLAVGRWGSSSPGGAWLLLAAKDVGFVCWFGAWSVVSAAAVGAAAVAAAAAAAAAATWCGNGGNASCLCCRVVALMRPLWKSQLLCILWWIGSS